MLSCGLMGTPSAVNEGRVIIGLGGLICSLGVYYGCSFVHSVLGLRISHNFAV